MPFEDWSTNPANNALVGAINWSEGQFPNTVNGSARQMMADLAVWRDSMNQTIEALSVAIPIGAEVDFGGSTAPSGWLLCYGQAVSRTIYADLFAVIGTTNGPGDGSTTFNLPDYRGRASVGKDDMGGTPAKRLAVSMDGTVLGLAGGAETHTLSTSQMPSHNHGGSTGTAGAHNHSLSLEATGSGGSDDPFPRWNARNATNYGPRTAQVTVAGDHQHTISADGSGQAHNNVQPSIVRMKIIRTGVV